MNSQIIRRNLNKVGNGKTKVKLNSGLREQGLIMQKRKKMWHHKRSSMQLDKDMGHNISNIEVMVLVCWSVEHAERSTLRDIVHRI